jgi:hypothetical protein
MELCKVVQTDEIFEDPCELVSAFTECHKHHLVALYDFIWLGILNIIAGTQGAANHHLCQMVNYIFISMCHEVSTKYTYIPHLQGGV